MIRKCDAAVKEPIPQSKICPSWNLLNAPTDSNTPSILDGILTQIHKLCVCSAVLHVGELTG